MILKSMIAYIAVPETEPAGQTVFTGVSLDDKDTGTNSQVIMQHNIWVGIIMIGVRSVCDALWNHLRTLATLLKSSQSEGGKAHTGHDP